MSRGFFYIMSNPSMPGIVRVDASFMKLEPVVWMNGLPTPFSIEYEREVPNADGMIERVGEGFSDKSVGRTGKYFNLDPKQLSEFVEAELIAQVRQLVTDFLPNSTLIIEGAV